MYHARMWVLYKDGVEAKGNIKPELHANVRINMRYDNQKREETLNIEGPRTHLVFHNAKVFFDYLGFTCISGLIKYHPIEGRGFVDVYQEVRLISNMIVWDAFGGKDHDKEYGIKRDVIYHHLRDEEDRENYAKGKVKLTFQVDKGVEGYKLTKVSRKRQRANSAL